MSSPSSAVRSTGWLRHSNFVSLSSRPSAAAFGARPLGSAKPSPPRTIRGSSCRWLWSRPSRQPAQPAASCSARKASWRERAIRTQGTSGWHSPLRVGSSDFGLLVLTSDSFEADHVETVAALATQVVVALENARLHRMVERQAMVDSLTGLANRRSLEESLRTELARATRFGDSVCVVLADLDDFKQVNDKYGHAAGDEVLKAFAGALRKTARESDVAGRWGGEEFALVLPGTDAAGGARLAERARAAIEERRVKMPNGDSCAVTASFGVAAFPESHELGEILAAADSALYAAKGQGKNRVVVSAESITT